MSDLASSCEYHTIEKTCLAVSESPKALANRQLRCLNDEKQSCCYICDSRQECTISCKFLGDTNTIAPRPIEAPKPVTSPIPQTPKTTEFKEAKAIPTTYCTSCNAEMTPKKAKLRLNENDDTQSKQFGDYTPQTEEILSVIIYLCPLCGKIEFKANRGT